MYAFSAGRGPCARVAACRTCDVPSRVNLVLSLYSMYIELLYPIVWWRTRASLYPFAHQSEICEIDLSEVKIRGCGEGWANHFSVQTRKESALIIEFSHKMGVQNQFFGTRTELFARAHGA